MMVAATVFPTMPATPAPPKPTTDLAQWDNLVLFLQTWVKWSTILYYEHKIWYMHHHGSEKWSFSLAAAEPSKFSLAFESTTKKKVIMLKCVVHYIPHSSLISSPSNDIISFSSSLSVSFWLSKNAIDWFWYIFMILSGRVSSLNFVNSIINY